MPNHNSHLLFLSLLLFSSAFPALESPVCRVVWLGRKVVAVLNRWLKMLARAAQLIRDTDFDDELPE